MSTFKNRITILAATILFFGACDPEQPQLRLTSSERIQVDTLFAERVKTFRPYLDSICDANKEAIIRQAVDSIIKVRREEERRLRARILKENKPQ